MKHDIAIIGGGVIGLAIAYYLKKESPQTNVAVYEAKYIGYGASTRNGSHIRVHFWSEPNVKFAVKSREMMLSLAKETGWNPIPYIGGYLWLVYDEDTYQAYRSTNNDIWRRYGVEVDFIEPNELTERYPYLNTGRIISGVLGKQDGKIHHDFVTYAYAHKFMEMKGTIYEYSKVEKIILENNKVGGIQVNGKIIETEKVVVAAGAWSKGLMEKIGIHLPLTPSRKELSVLEPVKFFIKPLIIDMKPESKGLYVCQTPRGEIMGSVDYPQIQGIYQFNNTIKYLSTYAKMVTRLIPCLKHLRILRIWSGDYNVSPDHSHILGRDDEWPIGLYVATGYSGHGFMMAPYTGLLMSKYILNEYIHKDMEPFLPTRFREGKLIKETMVIG